jgi:hypothetical protein
MPCALRLTNLMEVATIIQPFIDDRNQILSTVASQLDDQSAITKIGLAIPSQLPKALLSRRRMTEMMLAIHTAIKTGKIDRVHRPSRHVLKTFTPLDNAIKMAVSSF